MMLRLQCIDRHMIWRHCFSANFSVSKHLPHGLYIHSLQGCCSGSCDLCICLQVSLIIADVTAHLLASCQCAVDTTHAACMVALGNAVILYLAKRANLLLLVSVTIEQRTALHRLGMSWLPNWLLSRRCRSRTFLLAWDVLGMCA